MMKRCSILLAGALCLGACSMGQKIVHERFSADGKPLCRTSVVTGEDKETITKATRSVVVGENCEAKINFGSTEESAGSQTEKAINAILKNLTPLIGGGLAP